MFGSNKAAPRRKKLDSGMYVRPFWFNTDADKFKACMKWKSRHQKEMGVSREDCQGNNCRSYMYEQNLDEAAEFDQG